MSKDQVPRVPPTSWANLEHKAEEVRRKVAPESLLSPCSIDLANLFEFELKRLYGYDYQIKDMPSGIEAMTLCNSKNIILSSETYDGLHDGDGRARFTVAHELGHIIIHAPYLCQSTSGRQYSTGVRLNRSSLAPYEDPEVQANVFAARFLMPTNQVIIMLKAGANEYKIATTFGVSVEAARYCIQKLK